LEAKMCAWLEATEACLRKTEGDQEEITVEMEIGLEEMKIIESEVCQEI
jgi:hypothetical protein